MSAEKTGSSGGRYRDLTGQRFGKLIALECVGRRVSDGSAYWRCACDCGRFTVTSSNKLLQGKTTSCGCRKLEVLTGSRSYIGGTCVEIISSKKIPVSNTSGIKNVSFNRGKWMGKISFAGRQFYLGRYRDIEDAQAVVSAAEQIRDEVVEEIDLLQDSAADVFAQRIAELLEYFRNKEKI